MKVKETSFLIKVNMYPFMLSINIKQHINMQLTFLMLTFIWILYVDIWCGQNNYGRSDSDGAQNLSPA